MMVPRDYVEPYRRDLRPSGLRIVKSGISGIDQSTGRHSIMPWRRPRAGTHAL